MQGRITRIFVRPRPGRESEVRAGLARLAAAANVNLEPAAFDSTLFAVASLPESQSEATVLRHQRARRFHVRAQRDARSRCPPRRKLIEDIRPHGATRRINSPDHVCSTRLILGVLACVLGLVLGELLSVAVFHSTPGYLAFAFPVGNERIVTWQSVALAVGAGMAAAGVGVLWPLRDILVPRHRPQQPGSRNAGTRRPPLAAADRRAGVPRGDDARPARSSAGRDRRERHADRRAACACCRLLFDGAVNLFERLQRPLNGAATASRGHGAADPADARALAGDRGDRPRSPCSASSIQGAQANLERGLDASARGARLQRRQVWVTAGGRIQRVCDNAVQGPSTRARLSAPAGRRSVGVYRGSFLDWGDRRAVGARATAQLRDSRSRPASSSAATSRSPSARVREGGWAVLSQALASEHHLHVGQTFTLPSPQPARLRVAALSTNLGWPPGAIIMNSSDYARAWAAANRARTRSRPGRATSPGSRCVASSSAPLGPDRAHGRNRHANASNATSPSRLRAFRG